MLPSKIDADEIRRSLAIREDENGADKKRRKELEKRRAILIDTLL